MKSIANQRSKLWYEANKHTPEFTINRKERLRKWRNKFPERYLLQMAKFRAKELNREFDLSEEDIIIPEVCPVLLVPFKYGTPYAMSVDRKDPTKDYVKGNVQIISRKANLMKQNASVEELRNFAKWANTFQV